MVVGSLLLALLLGYQLYKLTQRWTLRARSAKVLDEIEMEFVNDVDIDEELLRHTLSSRWDDRGLSAAVTGGLY